MPTPALPASRPPEIPAASASPTTGNAPGKEVPSGETNPPALTDRAPLEMPEQSPQGRPNLSVSAKPSRSTNDQLKEFSKAVQVLDIAFPPMWLAGCFFDQKQPTITAWILITTMFCAAGVALKSNYLLTLKYYRNGFDSEYINKKNIQRPSEAQLNSDRTSSFIERSYLGLDETYSAIVSMSWLSLSRSP